MNRTSDFKEESQFRKDAESVLDKLLSQIDELEFGEFEPRRTPGTLSITFEDGAVFMLSLQTPTHELWLSANYTAWHFLRVSEEWVERDSGASMIQELSSLLTDKLDEDVQLEL
ncbi:MAG: iron donor protein CyaY [Myxococcota bacterium]|nr:iron donor protein CyaY [Myxococcota bacterium]